MEQIPSREYLDRALDFTDKERDLAAEFHEWLPDSIIDVHTHANGRNAVESLPSSSLRQVRTSFPGFSLEESHLVTASLYGRKTVRKLRFANPYKGINHRQANAYLVANSPKRDLVAVCGLPDDTDYTIGEIYSGHYAAVKMYPFYYDPPATTILQYYPKAVLNASQSAGLPIILHTPTPIANCIEEVLDIVESYPELVIILAHIGRQREATPAARQAFQLLMDHNNIVTDISMNTSISVYRLALEYMGVERILFGSDEPMSLLRYVEYKHPSYGIRFVSNYRYHWLDPDQHREYKHLAEGNLLVHFQVLTALRHVLDELTSQDQGRAKTMIFQANAARIFGRFL